MSKNLSLLFAYFKILYLTPFSGYLFTGRIFLIGFDTNVIFFALRSFEIVVVVLLEVTVFADFMLDFVEYWI